MSSKYLSARNDTPVDVVSRTAAASTARPSGREAEVSIAVDSAAHGVPYWPTLPLTLGPLGFKEPTIEAEYIAYRQSSPIKFIVLALLLIIPVPTFFLLLQDFKYGWAFFTAVSGTTMLIICVSLVVINRRCSSRCGGGGGGGEPNSPTSFVVSTETIHRREAAWRQEQIVAVGIFTALAMMFMNTFESNNQCAKTALLKDASLSHQRIVNACVVVSPSDLIILFMYSVTLGVRFIKVIPVMIFWFSMAFISLTLTTDRPLDTVSQIISRAVVYICIFTCVGCVVIFLEQAKRQQFITYTKLLRATFESRQTSDRIDALLAAMLPLSVLKRITIGTDSICDFVDSASVSFSDVVQFTQWSTQRSALQVVEMISALVLEFDAVARNIGVEKVKTIGDAYWAMAGLPDYCIGHESKICEFTLRQIELCAAANSRHPEWNGIRLRIGAHTGEVVGGVIGKRQLSYEVFGHTNEIAEELEQFAPSGAVLVSETTKHGVESNNINADFGFARYKPVELGEGILLETYLVYRKDQSRPSSRNSANRTPATSTERFDRNRFLKNLGVARATENAVIDPDVEWLKLTEAEEHANGGAGDSTSTRPGGCCCRCCSSVFLSFPSEDLNRQFVEFDWQDKDILRRLIAITHVVIVSGMTIGMLIETTNFALIGASLAVFLVAWIIGIVLTIVSFCIEFGKTTYRIYFATLCFIQIGVLVASALLPRGMLASNSWTFVLFLPSITSLVTPGSLHRIFPVLNIVVLCIIAITTNTQSDIMGNIFWFVISLVCPTIVSVLEGSHDKQNFILSRASEEAFLEATDTADLQREILEMVAPTHIVPAMLQLMELPASKRMLAQEIPMSTVCFCKVLTREHHHDAKEMWEDISSQQARMEAVLSKYPLLTKIKTVGGILIVAGPLEVTATQEQAAQCAYQMVQFALDCVHPERCTSSADGPEALINFSALAKQSVEPLAQQCGLHSGPLNAAVFGTERMAYDTFGDTMNTASRYMSTAKVNTVQVSAACHELVSKCTGGRQIFEEAITTTVAMKGKGDVTVLVL